MELNQFDEIIEKTINMIISSKEYQTLIKKERVLQFSRDNFPSRSRKLFKIQVILILEGNKDDFEL
jgi:hypothetical protein